MYEVTSKDDGIVYVDVDLILSGCYSDVTVISLCLPSKRSEAIYSAYAGRRSKVYPNIQSHSILQLPQSCHDLYRVFLACCFQDIGVLHQHYQHLNLYMEGLLLTLSLIKTLWAYT